jgi:hypothetical protein
VQGRKDRASKLFYTLTLDGMVPVDHPVRRIGEVLDLDFLYAETWQYYSLEGKPSIDPVVLFKLHLIGYRFGIPSERRLFRAVRSWSVNGRDWQKAGRPGPGGRVGHVVCPTLAGLAV